MELMIKESYREVLKHFSDNLEGLRAKRLLVKYDADCFLAEYLESPQTPQGERALTKYLDLQCDYHILAAAEANFFGGKVEKLLDRARYFFNLADPEF